MFTVSHPASDCPVLDDLSDAYVPYAMTESDIAEINEWYDGCEARRNAEADMDALAQQDAPDEFSPRTVAA